MYVACRNLNTDSSAVKHVDYAQEQLRKYLRLLPSEYGVDSQVLNMHNLIHLPDDVRHLKVPLSEVSAFWGEAYIGFFKHLVKSPNKPVTQIANRLNELESSDNVKIKKQINFKCKYDFSESSFLLNDKVYKKIK